MESLDKDLQKRVWQRVQSRGGEAIPQTQPDNLRPLILAVRENAAVYRRMARRGDGKNRQRWLGLYRDTQRCLAGMQGICLLRGEPAQPVRLGEAAEPDLRAVQKCYHRERRLWEETEKRSADPEHGVVFSGLAAQARAHCALLAEILGSWEKPGGK